MQSSICEIQSNRNEFFDNMLENELNWIWNFYEFYFRIELYIESFFIQKSESNLNQIFSDLH